MKTALSHLRNAFLTYFSTPIDTSALPDIQWIDFEFATGYGRAQNALKDLEENLLNSAARKKLEEKLLAAGAFGAEKKDFYFWHTDPHNWSDISYQSRSVIHGPWWNIIGLFSPVEFNGSLKPQYIALGDFNINAIPEGYVEPKGRGKYEICVTKVYLFVNDTFNFETKEYLGEWDLNEDDDYKIWGYTPLTHLFNSDFSNFKKHGYGQDFPVLSRLHRSKNFKPDCWEITHAK